MAKDELIRVLPPRSPAQLDRELARIIERLRWANSMPELVNIDDQLAGLEEAVKLDKLGWEAQRQAVLLRLKCIYCVRDILQLPRAKRGRPPTRNCPNGTILKTVPELGCPRGMYKKAQRVNAIEDWIVQGVIRQLTDLHKEFTVNGILARAESEQQMLRNQEPQIGGRIDDLYELVRQGRRFGSIYMDAPWPVPGTTLPYPTMSFQEIAALPINELGDPVRCHLHMWVLPGAIMEAAIGLVRGWGFRVVGEYCCVWEGRIGSGNYYRATHENCLICVRADQNDRFDYHGFPSSGSHARGQHSEKPEAVRKMIQTVSPPPRIELFARKVVEGWMTWGHGIERAPQEQDIEEPKRPRYWLTPQGRLAWIKRELVPKGRRLIDVCPADLPEGFNALAIDWNTMGVRRGDYVLLNMPFRTSDIENVGDEKVGPTKFVRKAISECQRLGAGLIAFYPTPLSVNLLLEAGAEAQSFDEGRIAFEEVETGEPDPSPRPVTMFVLPAPK